MNLAPPAPPSPPGWYPDPWRVATYRWWTGRSWTANVAVGHGTGVGASRSPRLPAWLSPPVLVAGVLMVPIIGIVVVVEPLVVLLALVPLVFIVPVLCWIDRLEPEPWTSRIHTFLWGATLAVLISSIVNVTVLLTAGEVAAAVISAPVIEEVAKGLGIWWAVRRREVDGPVDGIVYAGWVGAGFAMVENLEYFLVAADDGVLAETFVARALLTPFAHPLFAAWTGLAIGLAVAARRRLPWTAWWGLVIAIGLHAGWNGSIVLATELGADVVLFIAMAAFAVIFVLTILMVLAIRRAERRDYLAAMPHLAVRFHVPMHELGMFRTWSEMLHHRRALPRDRRRRFDDTHAALVRLAALHARPGPVDAIEEQRLAAQLVAARSRLVDPDR